MPQNASALSQDEILLREIAERSRQIVRASPVAMLVSRGPKQTVEVINDKFIKLFGYTSEDMPDVEHWWPLAYPDKKYREEIRAAWQKRIERALRTSEDIEPMEGSARCKDGSTKYVEFHLAMLGDAFVVSFVDITARKLAEDAMRSSEERFRLAAEAGRMYACEWDAATDMVDRSAECQKLLGSGAALRLPLRDIRANIHPEDLKQVDAAIESLRAENPTSRVAYRARKTDGSPVWLEQSFRGRFDEQGRVTSIVGMIADISGRKDAENAMKTLSGRLIEAQEQERRRIARDLHDDINQRLAVLNIELQKLAEDAPDSLPELRQRVEELGAKASEISSEVSSITHELHSPKLELLGIVAAMKGFCEEMKRHQNMSVEFRHSGVPQDLPRDISLCLFRIFQEGVRNAARHSGLGVVEAELVGAANEISLKIRDRGAGFTTEDAQKSPGMGLISMRERVGLVKGSIVIDSKPLGGTSIQVHIPLNG